MPSPESKSLEHLLTLPACQEEYPASCILPDLDPTQTQTDCLHAQAPPTDGDYQEKDGGDAEAPTAPGGEEDSGLGRADRGPGQRRRREPEEQEEATPARDRLSR